ncbi:MAG: hypothetical protein IMW85_08740 [Thermicanus sp.]|nr:hypothetical protein [Thermicanus sp.]
MFSGKLNKLRTYSMIALIAGVGIMYLAILVKQIPILMALLMLVGFLVVILSASSYFWIGLLSSRAVLVQCPTCGKTTKMLGKNDECMFCKQKLTLDPAFQNRDQEVHEVKDSVKINKSSEN